MKPRRPPLRQCDECKFCDLRDLECRCAQGHKPAFVVPGWEEIQSGAWGWMMRCRDFVRVDPPAGKEDARKIANEHSQKLHWRFKGEMLKNGHA